MYKAPELTADYCSKVCPIGQVLAHSVERSEFAVTVLRVLKEFADVERIKDRLIHIASDGKVSLHEEVEFRAIMKEIVELERWIGELKYFALRHGINVEDIMQGGSVMVTTTERRESRCGFGKFISARTGTFGLAKGRDACKT